MSNLGPVSFENGFLDGRQAGGLLDQLHLDVREGEVGGEEDEEVLVWPL